MTYLKKATFIALATAVAAISVSPASADPHHGRGRAHHPVCHYDRHHHRICR